MTISKDLKPVGALLVIIVAALSLAAPSVAGNLTGPDVTVRYPDLNIEAVEGATALLKRITVAATKVCAPLYHGSLASRANLDRCRQKLTAAAVTKVNHPVLAAVYKSARPTASTVAALAK